MKSDFYFQWKWNKSIIDGVSHKSMNRSTNTERISVRRQLERWEWVKDYVTIAVMLLNFLSKVHCGTDQYSARFLYEKIAATAECWTFSTNWSFSLMFRKVLRIIFFVHDPFFARSKQHKMLTSIVLLSFHELVAKCCAQSLLLRIEIDSDEPNQHHSLHWITVHRFVVLMKCSVQKVHFVRISALKIKLLIPIFD